MGKKKNKNKDIKSWLWLDFLFDIVLFLPRMIVNFYKWLF